MKPSKKEKIHDWTLDSTAGGVVRFRYRCRRCGHKTYNGDPLPMPQKESCSRT